MIEYKTLDIDGLWNKMDSRDIDFKKIVPRFQVENIIKRFLSNHVEVIIGPRQSGKTTLLMMLIHELTDGDILPQQIYYINLDTIGQMEQFKNPMLLVKQIDYARRSGERVYLFLDEVQRLESPGKFLKGLYDLQKNIKIFATGSSSLEVKSKIKEFLTGRKRETHLFPLSFKEFIRHENKTPGSLKDVKCEKASVDTWKQNETLFGRYLSGVMEETAIYGGYPAVLTAGAHEARVEELNEIYQSYVRKDVIEFLKVGNSEVFNNLVKELAAQVGNLVNKSEICSLLGSNAVTITKYMNVLKETYIAGYLPPWVSSRRSEVKSAHKCFFIDNGLRNFSLRQFNGLSNRADKGALIENLVFTELVKDNLFLNEELFFWRSKGGAEMDFVLSVPGKGGLIPIEIKAGAARSGLLSKSFHAFLDYFSPGSAIFLNRDLFHIEKVKQTLVYYIPNHWFLLYGLGFIVD
jgi:predicted AAA+ superfamily ATPase